MRIRSLEFGSAAITGVARAPMNGDWSKKRERRVRRGDAAGADGSKRSLPAARMRLDLALVARGLVTSRSRARDLVLRGEVSVAGVAASDPARLVGPEVELAVAPGAGEYVSRGTLKLRAALNAFALDVAGRVALDVGAAHGGFTEVLLEHGAAKVYAVDNGRGQLDQRLRRDPRVVSLEETDARLLTRALVPEPVGALVADVSFISLAKALPAALALTGPGAVLAALVKPQFEAGPGDVGKDGVVRDEAVRRRAVEGVAAWLAAAGWHVLGTIRSPITGGSGNVEHLIGAVRNE